MSEPSPESLAWPQLPPGMPIVLLPIRIETLYYESLLRVRIYPDIAHVDSHEPGLTEAEIECGLAYWSEVATAGSDPDRMVAAWSPLAARFGPERAAWIARTTRAGRPSGTPRPAGWSRAPIARLLPTRWHVAGFSFRGDYPNRLFDIVGAPIPSDLAIGPDPTRGVPPASVGVDGTLVDPRMRWMVDYAAAEEVGMAVTVPNPREVDRLLVYGVDETMTPQEGQARLAALLEAHYYTDGFGFVDPGTPTNNTTSERSGLVELSTALSERYRLGDATATAAEPHPAGSVAADLATALGLTGDGAGSLLARDPAGARTDHQALMNTVVWPSSWGYFLRHILQGISPDGIRAVRRHFIDHVRAGGPLPALRLGGQPYGVLPVMSYRGPEADDVVSRIASVTYSLGRTWLAAANNLPDPSTGRPRPPAGDAPPPGDPVLGPLLRILALQHASTHYTGRSVIGPEYMSSLWRFLRLGLDDSWRAAPTDSAEMVIRSLPWLPSGQRHSGAVFAEEAFPVAGPLVGTDHAAYLTELLTRTPTALRDAHDHGSVTPLLYRIVRDAALRELWTGLLVVDAGAHDYIEDELIDLDDTVSPTLWRGLGQPAPSAHGGPEVTIGEYLDQAARTPEDSGDPNVADLRDFRASVEALADVQAVQVERLLRGSLDLAAHRIDAWRTSLAGRRLAEVRATDHPTGVLVGGYGWVTDVKSKILPVYLDTPPGEQQPLHKATGNAGYVHAPSLRHATTAAILHAAYIARSGPEGQAGAVAVDLSAERVRLVARLLDGVRAGQPLDSVLGYRFERALAEGGTDGVPELIEPFRLLAPRQVQTLGVDGSAVETTEPGAVTDGLALFRRWRDGQVPWGAAPDPAGRPDAVLPAEGTSEYGLCVNALKGLADAVDALADAALAEGVHHLAAGNAARGGAALDAFTKGDAPPPDLDVIRTPRSGAVHTHRLMFLGAVNAGADHAAWPANSWQFRAAIEPTLNGLAAALLGDPHRVRCTGVWRAPDGSVRATAEVTLADTGMSALDVVCLAGGDRSDRLDELRQRFIDVLRLKRPPEVPEQPMPEPGFGRAPDWPADILSVTELLSMAARVRALLLAARPVRGEDLAAPGEALPIIWNVKGLRARASAARTELIRRRDELTAAVRARDIGAMGAGLFAMTCYGLPGAMSQTGRDWTEAWRTELVTQGTTVIAEAERRLTADAALQAGFDDATAAPYARILHELERMRTLLGDDFPVAPTWTLPASAQPALSELLSHGDALVGDDPLATDLWLDRLARVRTGARGLQEVRANAEATEAPAADRSLRIAQLPYVAGERWVALPPAQPGRQADRTALAVQTVREVNPQGEITGLVFDEWTEMVPDATETTGVAFHYDAPSSRPPQAFLLALPPGPADTWGPELVREAVSDALDLAQMRAMDLAEVGEFGHFLPALYFALNQTPSTVSTDFTGAGA